MEINLYKPGSEATLSRKGRNIKLDTPSDLDVIFALQEAQASGHSTIRILNGDRELCHALWLEGSLLGLHVEGYSPTEDEQRAMIELRAEFARYLAPETLPFKTKAKTVVHHYDQKVLPALTKKLEAIALETLLAPYRASAAELLLIREYHHGTLERDALSLFEDKVLLVNESSGPIGRTYRAHDRKLVHKALSKSKERFFGEPQEAPAAAEQELGL